VASRFFQRIAQNQDSFGDFAFDPVDRSFFPTELHKWKEGDAPEKKAAVSLIQAMNFLDQKYLDGGNL